MTILKLPLKKKTLLYINFIIPIKLVEINV